MTKDFSLRAEFLDFSATCANAFPMLEINQGFQHWRDTIERKITNLEQSESSLREQLRWIPVSERKPTVDDCRIDPLGRRIPYVIGIVDGHLHGLIHLNYFAKDNVYTHWMSLPEIPEVTK